MKPKKKPVLTMENGRDDGLLEYNPDRLVCRRLALYARTDPEFRKLTDPVVQVPHIMWGTEVLETREFADEFWKDNLESGYEVTADYARGFAIGIVQLAKLREEAGKPGRMPKTLALNHKQGVHDGKRRYAPCIEEWTRLACYAKFENDPKFRKLADPIVQVLDIMWGTQGLNNRVFADLWWSDLVAPDWKVTATYARGFAKGVLESTKPREEMHREED
jgi:hypothetical protein